MRIIYTNILIYLLFFPIFFITSIHCQESANVPQNITVESNIITIDTSVTGKQNIETPWVDPLFFIDGQLCQHVRKIYQDKSGNLWFGTNVYGLMRYGANPNDKDGLGDTLIYFDENNGFNGGRITGIVEDTEGNVWFGAYGGIYKYDGKSFTNYCMNDGLVDNEVWSLIIDSKGIFWIGTTEGVSRFDGREFTTFPIPKAVVKDTITAYWHNRISSIIEDKNGNIWFGTDGFGICRYDPGASQIPGRKTFSHFTKEDGLCDNTIYDMMEDSKGNIWIGTFFGGVSRFDGNTFTNFTEKGIINGVEVGGFYEDKNGNIWFAVENNGVYYHDVRLNYKDGQGKSFANLYKEEGLATNGILSIFEDKEGRFWFGGWGGLFRYDGKSFLPVTKRGPWK